MALFKIKNDSINKIQTARFSNEKQMQGLFERNLEAVFGVRFVCSEFRTSHGGRIDTLGLDENDAPVIIEYKESQNDNIMNQALFYMDWLMDHKGDFEVLVHKKFGNGVKVNWDEPAIILVAQSFNEYDKHAVNRVAGNIELWKYAIYEGDLLHAERINLPKGEKVKEKRQVVKAVSQEYDYDHHFGWVKNEKIPKLFFALRDEIIKMDGQIDEKIKKHYIAFSLDRNFCEVVVQAKALLVYLDIKKKQLIDPNNLTVDCSEVGHWATGHSRAKISDVNELPYLMSLVKQSYEKAR